MTTLNSGRPGFLNCLSQGPKHTASTLLFLSRLNRDRPMSVEKGGGFILGETSGCEEEKVEGTHTDAVFFPQTCITELGGCQPDGSWNKEGKEH